MVIVPGEFMQELCKLRVVIDIYETSRTWSHILFHKTLPVKFLYQQEKELRAKRVLLRWTTHYDHEFEKNVYPPHVHSHLHCERLTRRSDARQLEPARIS
ncbi:hypothetical protein PMAYCL1PPCAC_21286, partial [Pristionchus mayeri]